MAFHFSKCIAGTNVCFFQDRVHYCQVEVCSYHYLNFGNSKRRFLLKRVHLKQRLSGLHLVSRVVGLKSR